MKISVENVIKMMEFRKMVDSIELDEIDWVLNGKTQIISSDAVRAFQFVGLSNSEFVSYYFNDIVENAGLESLNISNMKYKEK